MNLSIFDMMYPKYKITKPIRLIELFSGYGSQALALKYLGVKFEHWRTCEWAIKSIQAYKDIHFQGDHIDYCENMNKTELVEHLYRVGISSNYNEPMSKEQITRLNEKQLKTIFNNIVATSDMVNIQRVTANELDIVDTDKYDYIMTYSFPCQDLSLAGKKKGMSDTSTRSGMLWEVERILTECKELGTMPQILLMENVPQVHGQDNMADFHKWQIRLEELGYKNYWQDLIATDYGIPQTRNRCFMVSILGNYSYTFPKPIPLEKKLKDMLESKVSEKYYLSDKMMEYITANDLMPKKDKVPQIAYFPKSREFRTTNWLEKSPSLTARDYKDPKVVYIKNANSKGYLEATEGDGVDTSSRMEYHRGTVQKGMTQTLTTMGGENNGVVVNMKTKLCNDLIEQGNVKENDVIRHNYTTSKKGNCIQSNNEVPTLDTRCDCLGVVNNMRIRKLTPRDFFRLMGVKDEDYEKCAKNQSDSSLYHLAGDSIVVNVLMAILKELL